MAKLHREPQIEVVITKDYCVWMLNRGTAEVDLPAGELFGFHMGAYVEAPVSQAASCQTSIPWLLENDKTPVILVSTSGGNTSKEIMPMAETMCWIARERGVTEAKVVDYTVAPRMKAGV